MVIGYLDISVFEEFVLAFRPRLVIATLYSELQANEKLYLRKMVAPIVLQLLKDKSNTDANLSEWQTYYVSPETCLDIKNSFLDETE